MLSYLEKVRPKSPEAPSNSLVLRTLTRAPKSLRATALALVAILGLMVGLVAESWSIGLDDVPGNMKYWLWADNYEAADRVAPAEYLTGIRVYDAFGFPGWARYRLQIVVPSPRYVHIVIPHWYAGPNIFGVQDAWLMAKNVHSSEWERLDQLHGSESICYYHPGFSGGVEQSLDSRFISAGGYVEVQVQADAGWFELGQIGVIFAGVDEEGDTHIPFVPYMIVHDPPGDQSYCKWEQEKVYTNIQSLTFGYQRTDGLGVEVGVQGVAGVMDENFSLEWSRSDSVTNAVMVSRTDSTKVTITSSTEENNPDYIGPGRGDAIYAAEVDAHWRVFRNGLSYYVNVPEQYYMTLEPMSVKSHGRFSAADLIAAGGGGLPWLADEVEHVVYDTYIVRASDWWGASVIPLEIRYGTDQDEAYAHSVTMSSTVEMETEITKSAAGKLGFKVVGIGVGGNVKVSTTVTTGQAREEIDTVTTVFRYFGSDLDEGDEFSGQIFWDAAFGTYSFYVDPSSRSSDPLEFGTQKYRSEYTFDIDPHHENLSVIIDDEKVGGNNLPYTPDIPWKMAEFDGSAHSVEAQENYVFDAERSRYVFDQWLETGETSRLLTLQVGPDDLAYTAGYRIQHYLKVRPNPADIGNISGKGFYDQGASVQLSAPLELSGLGFDYWDVDRQSQGAGVRDIEVLMNGPRTATAYYSVPDGGCNVAAVIDEIYPTDPFTDELIHFQGHGEDSKDHEISSYQWTSDIDNNIGSQASLDKWLSKGKHNISLHVICSAGESDTISWSSNPLWVAPNPDTDSNGAIDLFGELLPYVSGWITSQDTSLWHLMRAFSWWIQGELPTSTLKMSPTNQAPAVTITRSLGQGCYDPAGDRIAVELVVDVEGQAPVIVVGIQEWLPDGWPLDPDNTHPQPKYNSEDGIAEWALYELLGGVSDTVISYMVEVPQGSTGSKTFSARAMYVDGNGEIHDIPVPDSQIEPCGYSISGTARNEDGNPLAGVAVATDGHSDTTGADGSYTIDGLLAGTYTVTPSLAEYSFDPLSSDVTVNETEGDAIAVDFIGIEKTYSISGTITSGDSPLEGAQVTADGHSATTAADGVYTIDGLLAGTYTVTPSLAEYSFDPASSDVTVNKTDGNATDVDFVATPVYSHIYAAGQRMIGIPVDLSGSPTIEDIVGVDAVWWDPQGAGYITLGQPTPYVLGRGYWAQFAEPTNVEITGTEVTGQFIYDVYNGWNIISSPYSYEVSLESFTNAPTLRPFGWTYQGSGYELVASIADDPSAIHHSLQPWWGYWVLSDGDGTITWNPTSPSAQDVALMQIGQADADQGGWQIQLTAQAGSRVDLCNYCGVAGEQTAQALSIANPPPASGSVDLYFPTETRPMATDIRPTSQDKLAWEFEVRADLADTEVTVGYPDLSVVPSNHRLTLTDLDADKSTYMRTTHGYSYNSGPQGGVRHFRITAEPKGEVTLLVTKMTTQQISGQQAAITYTLSAAAQVDIQIRNIAGRVIQQVAAGTLQPAGINAARWNLTNASGSRVPTGTYLCIVTARTEEGQQASCLQPIILSR